MPDAKNKARVQQMADGIFFVGWCAAACSLIFMAVTKQMHLGARMFMSIFWLMFACLNAAVFYTGTFKWKNGPTYTREQTPKRFYASAIFFAGGSMIGATFLLWAAYTK